MCVLLFDVFNGYSTSTKEINSKAIFLLLFDLFNGYYRQCQTFTFEKNWCSQNFWFLKFEEMH